MFCNPRLIEVEILEPNRYSSNRRSFCSHSYIYCSGQEDRGLARRRKRKSRRRLEGRRILEAVPQFSIECGEDKPVTAARKYIHSEGITPPALLLVKRNEHTTDRYFWAEKGLFGAQYVEENHFLFPSLRALIGEEEEAVLG